MSFSQPSGGAFGSASFGAASSSGVLGTAAPAAGGFGSSVSGGGGFGSATPASGGFGATPTKPATGGFGAGSGGFGSSGATTGGFGSSSASGGFGATTPAAGGFGGAPSAGGFGAASPATGGFGTGSTSTGGFGTAPTLGGFGAASSSSSAGGSFGATSSGFGSTTGGGLSGGFGTGLGSSLTTGGTPGASAFGATPSTTGASGFGGAAGGFGGGGFGGVQSTQQQPNQRSNGPTGRDGYEGELSRIAEIRKQYAPIQVSSDDSPHGLLDVNDTMNSSKRAQGPFPWNEDCAFKFTVYPPKDSAGHHLQFADEYLDPVAIDRNPDPARLVPRTLMGATELLHRYKTQNNETSRMVSELENIKERQIGPIRHEQAQLSVKFKQYKEKQHDQSRRLIKLLRDIEVLRNRGRPLHNAEIKHREDYDRSIVIKKGYEGKLGQLSELNEVYASDVAQNLEDEYFEEISDSDLQTIYGLLSKQHEGIVQLASILNKDIRDVELILSGSD